MHTLTKARQALTGFRDPDPSTDQSNPQVKQRKKHTVPLTRSPFVDMTSNELKTALLDVTWSDLLLDLAMTTAFASLTDGVPILFPHAMATYATLFGIIWWTWASQVAYNVRFRQPDWFHRVMIFPQVFAFCALPAFVENFNITTVKTMLDENSTARISMTIGISRVVLLVQYLVVFGHAFQMQDRQLFPISNHTSFLVHIASLLFSSLCYFIAFAVVRLPSKTVSNEIAVFFLWYTPLVVEVLSHFLAISRFCGGRVNYNSNLILDRSSTVFVIFLGGGLDRVTNAFHAMAALVRAGNLRPVLDTSLDFVRQSNILMQRQGFPVNLTRSDYSPDLVHQFQTQQFSLAEQLPFINTMINLADQGNQNNHTAAFDMLLQMDIYVLTTIMDALHILPDYTPNRAYLEGYYEGLNGTVSNGTFNSLVQKTITGISNPVLWFYGAGGSVLVTLGLMGLIRQWPRDKYEWAQIGSRLLIGSLVIIIGIAGIGHDQNRARVADFQYEISGIWWLVQHSWALFPYALVLLFEQVIEAIFLHLAGRTFEDLQVPFLPKSRSRSPEYSRMQVNSESEIEPRDVGLSPKPYHSMDVEEREQVELEDLEKGRRPSQAPLPFSDTSVPEASASTKNT
ncbi:hypothetical protein K435DRAFT_936902 [Dendrothele bispora CBS 962.96]|uniref:Uncharacterized protein n=1 Tax=Dendrothele bispora (strain CBS 962.96) TaxID=1314807 RepID=A0A4S8MBH9_DENBC|nr:hypothetical protein K435DRAFT_936902 [Dendrothele bispora CBS 962.96]